VEKKVATVAGIYPVMRCPVCGRDVGVHQGRLTTHGPGPAQETVLAALEGRVDDLVCAGSGRVYDPQEG